MSTEITWFDAPDPTEVHNAYKQLASVRGKILRLERQIAKLDAELKREYPRKPNERDLAMTGELDQLTEWKVLEEEILQELKFYDKRFEMFKALSYRKG